MRAGQTSSGIDPRATARFVLRLALAYLVLATTAVVCERPILAAMVPVVRTGFAVFHHDDVAVRSISTDQGQLTAGLVVRRDAPSHRGHVKVTTASNGRTVLLEPLLALSLLIAWRFRSRREKAVGLLVGVLFAFVLVAHNESFILLDYIDDKVGRTSGLAGALASFWGFFLANGGRQLLGLAAGAAAIGVVEALRARPQPIPAPAPARSRSKRKQQERRARSRASAAVGRANAD